MKRIPFLTWCLLIGFLAACTPEQTPSSPKAGPEGKSTTDGDGGAGDEGVTAGEVRKELDEAADAVEEYSTRKTEEALREARNNLDEVRRKIAS